MKLNKKAFTLVEMLIVVVIIGILAAALLPKLMSAQGRARDTARKADLNQIMTAMKMYYDDEGTYPDNATTEGCVGTGFKNAMDPYMSEVPADTQKKREINLDGTHKCTHDYAYVPIKSSGTTDGAAVLAANLEIFGKSMNWVLNGSSTTDSQLTGGAIDTWDIKGTSNLIKNKCTDGVFQGAANGFCGTAKRGSATEDWQGVYIIFVN